jgi:hypothetical protein
MLFTCNCRFNSFFQILVHYADALGECCLYTVCFPKLVCPRGGEGCDFEVLSFCQNFKKNFLLEDKVCKSLAVGEKS